MLYSARSNICRVTGYRMGFVVLCCQTACVCGVGSQQRSCKQQLFESFLSAHRSRSAGVRSTVACAMDTVRMEHIGSGQPRFGVS